MIEKWNRIKAWLKAHAPHLLDALNPPASEDELNRLERLTGCTLPPEFKAFYRIHNGQNPHAEGIWAGEELLSIARIAEEWDVWRQLDEKGEFDSTDPEVDPGIRKVWWCKGWLPITYDGAGNHDCLDMDPGEGGEAGQVLRMWHDDAERYLVALDFNEFVDFYIEDLEGGVLIYDENEGIVESGEGDWENDHDDHHH